MPNFKRKLTEAQRDEIIEKYIAPCFDKTARKYTQTELAEEYGVTAGRINQILHDADEMRRLDSRTSASVIRARALAKMAAPMAMEETIKDALKDREDNFRYINQNACRDILDRAGVRQKEETRQEITINFASGIELGIPDHGGDEQEVPDEETNGNA